LAPRWRAGTVAGMSTAAADPGGAPVPSAEASPVDLIAGGLDLLAAEDLRSLASEVRRRRVLDLFTQRNRLDAELTRRIGDLDRSGAYARPDAPTHSAASWLRSQAHLSPNAASEQVRVARQLRELPEATRAYQAGELGFQHCATITRVLEDVPAAVVQEAEPELVKVAQATDPYRLGVHTRHLRHTFAPDAGLAEFERLHERRRLHLSESSEGLWFLDGVLDPECGAGLRTALDALMGPPARDDERKPSQRRHDALWEVVRRQLDGGELPRVGGQRPHLTLTASVATLAKLPGSPAADLDWGQPVPADTLRRIACDCEVTPVLVSESGDPLSVGRTRRTFTPAQRRALAVRDKGCVLCGCAVSRTEAHHLEHWIDGGETSVRNGALACPRCHRKLHEGGFKLIRKADRTWATIRRERPPFGRPPRPPTAGA